MIAKNIQPPYYAVIFTSERTAENKDYEEMADSMMELAQSQVGFLGVESARSELGITISYWKSIEAIKNWKKHSKHQIAQERGKKEWYQKYTVRICKVESDYFFEK